MNWHFYDKVTGLYLGRTFSGPKKFVEANTPPGAVPILGTGFNPRLNRWNLETLQLEEWEPPVEVAPDDTHRIRARRRISQLESRQARAVREQALGYDGARERLKSIDDEIATLRAELNG